MSYLLVRPVSVLGGVALFGCFEPIPPVSGDGLAWHSERVDFGTDLVDEVCLGTLELLDRDVEAIEQDLELEPDPERIKFWVLSDVLCSPGVGACAHGSRVFSLGTSFLGSHHHELVHARLAQIRPSVKPFFEEGLATTIGGGDLMAACGAIENCGSTPLDDYLAITDGSDLFWGYWAGADMVRGMLGTEGATATLEFTADIERKMPPEQVRALYAEQFDTSLEADFQAYKRGVFDEFTPAELNCEAAPAPQYANGAVFLQASMECALPNVINDFSQAQKSGVRDGGIVEWSFVVEPENAGAYVLTGPFEPTGDYSAGLFITRCIPEPLSTLDTGPWRSVILVDDRQLFLGPGLHKIEWRGQLDVGANLDEVLAPACTFEDQDCPAGEQCTIWNLCVPEVAQPAALGESCQQFDDEPLACAAGSRCLGGVCVAECDATQPCGAGQGCTRVRVCGTPCNLVAQDCESGFTCLPSEEPELVFAGTGQCVAAGDTPTYGGCAVTNAACSEGLSCEPSDFGCVTTGGLPQGEACCLPICDPSLEDPGCPDEIPTCRALFGGVAGVCRT